MGQVSLFVVRWSCPCGRSVVLEFGDRPQCACLGCGRWRWSTALEARP